MHSPSPAPSPSQLREQPDPTERSQPIPLIAAGITLIMVLAGAAYIMLSDPFGAAALGDRRTLADLAPAPTTGVADGKQVFAANCVACHQATGSGLPGVFPPLDGSEWVNGDTRVLANILLNGVEGELTVKGQTYAGAMPAFKQLGDAELAAVASFVRSNWSNAAPAVTADLFAREREHLREKPFAGGAALKALASGGS